MKEIDLDSVEIEKLSQEELDEFFELLVERKRIRKLLPVEALEAEFDKKSEYLRYNPMFELSEIDTEVFIQMIFNRDIRVIGGGAEWMDAFEEIQSPEYREWLRQRREGRKSKRELAEADQEQEVALPVDYEKYRMWRYNPIVFFKEGKEARHRLLLKDDVEGMQFLKNRKFAIVSPATFVGRTNSYANARYLYAIAIDLDGIGVKELGWLLGYMKGGEGGRRYPIANMIVNSGHGVHVYYLLEKPVAMYEPLVKLLNKLKAGLTRIIWNVSQYDDVQMQSVIQGFRVPGSLTKFGKPVVAFCNYEAPLYTLEELNRYVPDRSEFKKEVNYHLSKEELKQLSDNNGYIPTGVTLQEAQKLWPEWYASRVVGKSHIGKTWKVNRGLYDWWLKKLRESGEVKEHHRYWCILTLVVFAVKCNVPREVVERDALSLVDPFNKLSSTVDNPFTVEDVMDAMRAYDAKYNKWPRHTIESTSGIRVPSCRRNGRKQAAHLKRARVLRDLTCEDNGKSDWREGNGRKKGSVIEASESRCAAIIKDWQEKHPGVGNKSLCARDTGLSRTTVHKWWK